MQQAVIVDAIRTPMGRAKLGGAPVNVYPIELLGQVLAALVERNSIDPGAVDDVICGCVSQVGEQAETYGVAGGLSRTCAFGLSVQARYVPGPVSQGIASELW